MDTTALASTFVAMQSAQTAQQMSLLALKQAAEMQQNAVELLAAGAEAGRALLPDGVGSALDRSV